MYYITNVDNKNYTTKYYFQDSKRKSAPITGKLRVTQLYCGFKKNCNPSN
ncbi:hypothetical protein NIASO_17315 [Niabella soli DSM 19437]|uniref:Uncharacterized protein n=1 Tax=Niabella soli DSM 19437 TaxID=929713 RepID=W0F988_9BACT|nr:hypothetical protein NIASO_17315 [Niabella soli DSM 19437]